MPPALADAAGGGLARALYTVGGLGRLPGLPGTYASLAGWGFFWAALAAGGEASAEAGWGFFLCCLAGGLVLGRRAEAAEGRRDPPAFVLDEVAGIALALAGPGRLSPAGAALGFALFRALDMLKPFPLGRLQRLEGAAGIMADDLAAGLAVNIFLHCCGCFR